MEQTKVFLKNAPKGFTLSLPFSHERAGPNSEVPDQMTPSIGVSDRGLTVCGPLLVVCVLNMCFSYTISCNNFIQPDHYGLALKVLSLIKIQVHVYLCFLSICFLLRGDTKRF